MELFVNEYQYTLDFISESTAAWWRRKFKNGYISMGISIFLILLITLLVKQPELLTLEFLPLLLIILFKQKEKRAVKLERDRIEVIFRDMIPVIRVEIGEEIHMVTPKSESHVSFADVDDLFETRNLIVLLIKGSMTLALDKRGFKRGDAEGCLKYLKEHVSIQ